MKKVFLVMAVLVSAIFTVSAQSADDIIAKYITYGSWELKAS